MGTFKAEEVAKYENETWSRSAQSYTEGFGPLVMQAIPPLIEAVGIEAGQRVLDVGTGPGMAAAAAAELGADVVGIDFSEEMLAEARRQHPELDFRLGSAESLPFSDGEFDRVIGNFLLHHSGDPGAVLAEARRVLCPGGRVGFTIWGDPARLEAFGVFFAAVEEQAGEAELPHGPLFGVSDFEILREMAMDAGLEEPRVRGLDISWKTPSLETYLRAFRDWSNLNAFPPEVQAAVEAGARSRAANYRVDGHYDMPNPAILITASK